MRARLSDARSFFSGPLLSFVQVNRVRTEITTSDDVEPDLVKAYQDLPDSQQVLDGALFSTLEIANDIYTGKGFEYIEPIAAARGYSHYPELPTLDEVARQMIEDGKRLLATQK